MALEEPVAQFEGEETPVVEAAYSEAATDEDIEAEERRLLGEEAGVPPMETPSPALVAEAEVVEAPAPAETAEEPATETPPPLPEAAAPSEEVLAAEPTVAEQLETIALPPQQEPFEAAYTDPQPKKLQSDIAFLTTPDPAKEKVDTAVSRALSAFDAFKDDPEVEA